MDYSIKWNLLSPQVIEYFESVGVKRLPHGMEFSRNPTWTDFTLVLAYLYDLEKNIADKDNHIPFAIGYCVHTGVELFGEQRVFDWIDEFSKLVTKRDLVLELTGSTLVLLQNVENQIMLFCVAMQLKGIKVTLQDFLSVDILKRKQTLGQLANILKEEKFFNEGFESQLGIFIEKRNRFIHDLWVEQGKKHKSESGLPSIKEYEEIHVFISILVKEAHYIYDVFKGFYYLVESRDSTKVERTENSTQQWNRYIEEFKRALR